MNPFARTARVALTSSLVAAGLATAGLVLSPLAQAEYSPLAATTGVNVRQSPDTSSSVVAVLSAGDTVTQRGTEQDGWLPITYNGKDAWIQAQYVSSTTAITNSSVVGSATLTDDVLVRSDTTSSAWMMGSLTKGSTVSITGDPVGSLTPINYYGRAGWVPTKYLSDATDSSAVATITKAISQDYLWVRSGESTAYASLGMLYPGDEATVTGEPVGGWVPISYKGQDAFVAANYSRYESDPSVIALVATTENTSDDDSSSDSAAADTDSTESTDQATPAPEATTEATDDTTSTDDAATSDDTTADESTTEDAAPVVTGTNWVNNDVNVRTGPGTDYPVVTTLDQGTQVDVTGNTNNGWSEIVYDGTARWISSRFLSDTPVAAEDPEPADTSSNDDQSDDLGPQADATPSTIGTRYTTSDLNAYLTSTQGKPASTVIPAGTAVDITGNVENNRAQLVWNGTVYWASVDYLSDTQPTYEQDNSSSNDQTATDNSSSSDNSSAAAPSADAVSTAVNFAMSKLGGPYVWGGTGPTGYDCSGLVQAAYAQAGITLPRTTWQQVSAGTTVASTDDLQVGDLVFFYNNSHVGIYIGDGQVVNALNETAGIVVTPISYMPISAMVRVA